MLTLAKENWLSAVWGWECFANQMGTRIRSVPRDRYGGEGRYSGLSAKRRNCSLG